MAWSEFLRENVKLKDLNTCWIIFSLQHAIQGRSFYSPAVLKLKCGYSITHQQGINFPGWLSLLCVTIRRTLIILSSVSDSVKRLVMKPANMKDENWELRHLPDHAQSNKLNWVLRLDGENFKPFLKQFTSTPRFLIWHFLLVTDAYFLRIHHVILSQWPRLTFFREMSHDTILLLINFPALFTTDSLHIFAPF